MVGAKRLAFKNQEVFYQEAEMKDYEKANLSVPSHLSGKQNQEETGQWKLWLVHTRQGKKSNP